MIGHILLLYLPAGVVVAMTLATLRRRGDPDVRFRDLRALWPFPALAALESLQLRAAGHMVAEWLVPMLAACFALMSRSPRVVAWSRRAMIVAAVALWAHGMELMRRDYATRPFGPPPGARAESDWMTPWTGFRRVVR